MTMTKQQPTDGQVDRIRLGLRLKRRLTTWGPQTLRELTLKMRSHDVISHMHSLTSLKIVAELSCHQGTFSATCVCLLFGACLTLFNYLIFFPGMAEGHLLLEQGGQQAAQHRRSLPEGHVLFQRCQRQKGKENSQSM